MVTFSYCKAEWQRSMLSKYCFIKITADSLLSKGIIKTYFKSFIVLLPKC